MAYAFKGNSFKSYNYRPYHWVGAQGGASTPTDTVGRTVAAFSPMGTVSVSTPSGSVNANTGPAQINASL